MSIRCRFAAAFWAALFAFTCAPTLAQAPPQWSRGVRWTPEMGEPFGFAKTEADALDAVVPGRFIVDPPTIHNLGFRWYIQGDANRRAKVEVAYRKKGEAQWREALPMLRVHHEVANKQFGPWRCGNLFAGSVMFLEAGTEYEVRFTMSHPDGAGPPAEVVNATSRRVPQAIEYENTGTGLVVSVSTREEPPFYEGERQIQVLPPGHDGPVPEGAAANLAEALAQARPGDVILVQPGLHIGSFEIAVSGELGRPIVVRGSDEGPAVVSGPLDQPDLTLFHVRNASHIHFENLVMRRARIAVDGGRWGESGASWLVLRGCRIEDVRTGIVTTSEKSEHWYVADNVIVGRNPSWHPRREPGRGYMEPSHTGVNVYGQGHVVAHNLITRFSDSLAIANINLAAREYDVDEMGTEYLCNNLDFHHNDMSVAQDDILETDYGCHNIRVYRNRGYNAYSGISMQPTYGGPIYVIRNEMYAMTRPYKRFNFPTGYVFYHNTSVSQGDGIRTMRWTGKSVLRNNIFLGGRGRWAVSTGSLSPHTSWDYNAYSRNHPERFINWSDHEENQRTFRTLEEFAEGAGHERHGIEVDYDAFVLAPQQRPYQAILDPNEFDLRLRPGTAPVDAGVRLPNVNDDYAGAAPDMGAHELGQHLPRYGPRPELRPKW